MTDDVKVELQLGGSWTEVTPRVSNAISISRGRSNWSGQVDSARASMLLDNRDGSLSPDYPAGVNYGNLQRNIPLRISQLGSSVGLLTDCVSSDVASTPDILGSGGGSPTAPVMAGVTSSAETSYVTSHDCSLPATLAEGDRLLLLANSGHTSFTATSDLDDWTLIESGAIYSPWNTWRIYEIGPITAAQATAMEGTTVEFTTTTGVRSSFQVIRTTGAREGDQGIAWDIASVSTTSYTDSPNPPSLTTGWGDDENRWYAIAFYASHGADVSNNPTNYTAMADGDLSALNQIATAQRTTSSGTEDPGVFTLDKADNWHAVTFVYRAKEDTSSDGPLDISGDLELRFECEFLKDIKDGGIQSWVCPIMNKRATASGFGWRLFRLENVLYVHFFWAVGAGSLFLFEEIPLDIQVGITAMRITLDVDNGAGGHEVKMFTSDSIDGTWTEVASTTGSGTTSITTNDGPLRVGGEASTLDPYFPGIIRKARMYDGIGGTLVVDADFTAQTAGATSFVDNTGRTWNIGANAELSNRDFRFHGELSSLPIRQNHTGDDVVVPVEAHGLFRRLRQGNRRLASALRRAIPRSEGIVQYWPMTEEGDNVTAFGPAVGSAAIQVLDGYPNAASASNFLSAGPMPTPGGTTWVVDPDSYTGSGSFQIRWLQTIPADAVGTDLQYMIITTTDITWLILFDSALNGAQKVVGYRGNTEVYNGTYLGFNALGTDRRVTFKVVQNGSNVDVGLEMQDAGVQNASGLYVENAVAGLAGEVTQIRINRNKDIGDWIIGHLSLQNAVTGSTEFSDELNAFQGEKAANRIYRLCNEEGLDVRIEGNPDDTEPMGPQLPNTLMGLLQECADTDLGLLYEDRKGLSVAYRPRSSMVDQAVAVTLDSSANELAGAPELDRDDYNFANDVEIVNWNGTIANAVLNDGSAMSVSPPPIGVGSYDSEYRVVALNSRLGDLANTRLLLNSVDEPRVSNLGINLQTPALVADTALTEQVLGMDLGDRIKVTNSKAEVLGSAEIDQLVQGYTEQIGHSIHRFGLLTTPASPWSAGGGVVEPPAEQFVNFRTQQDLAYPGSPAHVLTALGYTSSTKIVRADLDGILDSWVASTGGTTHNVTSEATWTTAMSNAVPGDLVRVTSTFTGEIRARHSRYGITGANMTNTGNPGLPIILTCADGAWVEPNDTGNDTVALDMQNTTHVWTVGFNCRNAQFGIRHQNWGGTMGFPAYAAYNRVENTGHAGMAFQGWFQAISSSGGTIPTDASIASPGMDWGLCEEFVCESNWVEDPGRTDAQFGEAYYFGIGSSGGGWHGFCRNFWVRGNHAEYFTSDAFDIKPGCHYGRITDNTYSRGYAVSGAPMQLCYVFSGASNRPAWFDFDPEIYCEGNRGWDSDITNTNGSSDHVMGYVGISGIRIANNITWGHNQTGSHAAWRFRTEKGTNDTDILDEFRTDPTWVVNHTERGASCVEIAGYGVPLSAFPSAITNIIDVRNCLVENASPGTGEVDMADSDFITTIPAVGAAGDAEWNSQGAGSAFDLAPSSALIGTGDSIADLDLLIDQDISQRPIPNPPTPGAFQPFPVGT